MVAPRRVLLVALPGVQLLDVVGPLEVFDAANRVLAARRKPPAYRCLVGGVTRHVKSASGVALVADCLLARAPAPHTLVIGGGQQLVEEPIPQSWLRPLRRLCGRAERVMSVCTGSFVLGELGMLDGRRCTTHWMALDAQRQRYPLAQVESDVLYTRDGSLFTSAGVASGIDLALSVLEYDLGASVALAVARALVVFLHRSGGQSQFSAVLSMPSGVDRRIRDVTRGISAAPAEDHSVDSLAKRSGLSSRQFARLFRSQTGVTPAAFVERVRVEAARRLLETTDDGTVSVASAVGFGTDETMRRAFQRQLTVSPADYRRRFQRRHRASSRAPVQPHSE